MDRVDPKSLAISVGFHAALLLIMLAWPVLTRLPEVPREIEILLASPSEAVRLPDLSMPRAVVSQPRIGAPVNRAAARTGASGRQAQADRSASAQGRSSEADRRNQSSGPARTAPVPPSGQRTADPVEFRETSGGAAAKERSTAPPNPELPARAGRESGVPGGASRENAAADASRTPITKDPGQLSGTPSSSASVTWESGVARSRTAGGMPVFPPGVDRSAQIRIRFRVRPDGTIDETTILQKGEPRLEQAALAALRGWRFNALSRSAPQGNQQGTVTFYFKLK